ncbi:MAG TPA: hypothetical protein VLC98_00680 [Phnomibacter sp.]|nr:hypothetical protein [Phnomibacter sp.]
MRIYWLALFLLLGSRVQAQTEKHSLLVGGGFAMRSGEGVHQFMFNPTVGWFAAKDLAIGGMVSFNGEKVGGVTSSSTGIGPFVRYYFGKAQTRPFVVSEWEYVQSNTKQSSTSSSIKAQGNRLLLGLGFAAFLSETVALEGVTGYSYSKFKNTDANNGFALRLGFGVYLNRKANKAFKEKMKPLEDE